MQHNTVYFDYYADFNKLRKAELARSGKLHGEAWQHRMKGEFNMMKGKQDDAKGALYKAKSYEYWENVYA